MGMNGSNRRRSNSSGTSASRGGGRGSGGRGRRATSAFSGDGGNRLRFSIPSAAVLQIRDPEARGSAYYSEGRAVQKAIMDAVERCGFDSDSVFAIKLALEEALIN